VVKTFIPFQSACNNCNWEFRGFAVPGTVSSNPRRNKKKPSKFAASKNDDAESVVNNKVSFPDSKKVRTKKRVKINP
jgi:hypothetical protein